MAGEFMDRPFGRTLADLGERYENLIVLDADLQLATETHFFEERFPRRQYNVGVAEANMVGIAAGLALSGKTVFCGTFACFIGNHCRSQLHGSIEGLGTVHGSNCL